MALVDELAAAIAAAMKGHEVVRLATLRLLKTALVNKAVEKGRDLDEAESRQVVVTLVKQRRESIEQFLAGRRQDLADREKAEIVVLEEYLPPTLDAAALARLVEEAVAESGANSVRDLGKVMKLLMPRLAGQAVDGKAVNELVRQKLVSAGS